MKKSKIVERNLCIVLLASIHLCSFSKPEEDLCQREQNHAILYSPGPSDQHLHSLFSYATCLHRKNEVDLAVERYFRIRLLYPDFRPAITNIAITYIYAGKIYEAATIMAEYFWGVPQGEECSVLRYEAGVDGEYERDEVDGNCVQALNVYGSALLSYGLNNSEAVRIWHRAETVAAKNTPMLDDVYLNLGAHYLSIGQTALAESYFFNSFLSRLTEESLNPSPLVRRAVIIPPILGSIMDRDATVQNFKLRIEAIISLCLHGGKGTDDGLLRSLLPSGNENGLFLDALSDLPPLAGTLPAPYGKHIQTPHFYLHYYGIHDRPLQELVAQMYGLLAGASLFHVSKHLHSYVHPINEYGKSPIVPGRGWPTGQTDRDNRVKITFVSSHFGSREPHGQLLLDTIRHLPRTKFTLYAVGVGSKLPSEEFVSALYVGEVTGSNYERFISVGYDEIRMKSVLEGMKSDVIVFGEMQNEAMLHLLGFGRYAPIQILVMGSPVTSGNPSIDYFLSGDRLEHPFRTSLTKNEEHYTEQIVMLDGQAISFPPFSNDLNTGSQQEDANAAAGDAITRKNSLEPLDELHYPIKLLKNNTTDDDEPVVYMCFQNIFKLQPSFDFVLAQILHADPTGHIVLQASRDQNRTAKMSERLERSFAEYFCPLALANTSCEDARLAASRSHFVPRVVSSKITEIMSRATVVLHPFPFGGSTTASDAFAAGVPLVTLPQPYLRGRMASTFLATMRLHQVGAGACCVATSAADYVSKAVRLGRDRVYRDSVVLAIASRAHRIWNDRQVPFEWARFLTRASGIVVPDNDLRMEVGFTDLNDWQTDDVLEEIILAEQRQWRLR